MRSRTLPLMVAALGGLLAVGAGACGSDSANAINVVSTASSCEPAATALKAGKTTFKVQNKGSDVTELYVLQGNRTIGEVENVGAGTSRNLTVNLKAGTYELACKPGMKGDGIKATVTVTGSGGEQSQGARQVDVKAADYSFSGLEHFTAKAGETIEFELENGGTVHHELEIIGPDGRSVGEVSETDPGRTGEARITLAKAGTYTFKCGLDDHEQRGMKGTFPVT